MPYAAILTVRREVQAAVGAQDAIGWMNMVEGCVALQWEEVQPGPVLPGYWELEVGMTMDSGNYSKDVGCGLGFVGATKWNYALRGE